MIVACERCHTRFQLDDARVPPGGIRVRCSRCKHAFLAVRPGGSEDDTIHGIALASAHDAQPTPQLTSDLAETRVAAATSVPAASAAGEDEDWTFNEPMPDPFAESARGDRTRPPLAAAPRIDARATTAEVAPAPDEPSLDAIGSPDSWDFGVPEPATLPTPDARAERESSASGTTPEAVGGAALGGVPPQTGAASEARTGASAEAGAGPRAAFRALPRRLGSGPELLGWGASALLLVVIAGLSLAPRPLPRAALSAPPMPVGGLVVEGARGRIVENAVAGPLLVVSATLRNGGERPAHAGAAVAVTLVGVDGLEPSAARRLAGRAPAERRLREALPAELEEEIAGSAPELGARTLAPGESIEIAALFPRLPRALGGIAIGGADASAATGEPAREAGAAAATSAASLP